ncbi:Uncharacterised protein [Klebsiella pneumoniae]|nr:Uncharacterised protein [Klebsiella pneumoniae]SWM44007.1 Uncharacterised protein [Klebsiella pneumoniae]VGJ55787.1 Uncharacterised protein [Klebsiella pneumoniae]
MAFFVRRSIINMMMHGLSKKYSIEDYWLPITLEESLIALR